MIESGCAALNPERPPRGIRQLRSGPVRICSTDRYANTAADGNEEKNRIRTTVGYRRRPSRVESKRTSYPSDRTPPRCPRRREVPAHGRAVPQSRSRAHRRSSHRRHRRWLASCPPRAESSHGVVRCTHSPPAEKAMVPGGGAGDPPSTRQGITHLSGNSGDCSGQRSGRTYRPPNR